MAGGGFEEFFRSNCEPVVRALALVTGNADEAEELAQEAFARAYRRWRDVGNYERPAAWVYVVALNHGRRGWQRKRRPDSEGVTAVPDPAFGVDNQLEIAEALRRLPERQRLAVVLRFVGDLTVAEVAQAMGCASGTVKSTLHAALKAMRVDIDTEVISP